MFEKAYSFIYTRTPIPHPILVFLSLPDGSGPLPHRNLTSPHSDGGPSLDIMLARRKYHYPVRKIIASRPATACLWHNICRSPLLPEVMAYLPHGLSFRLTYRRYPVYHMQFSRSRWDVKYPSNNQQIFWVISRQI
jgi:hypothetical protein